MRVFHFAGSDDTLTRNIVLPAMIKHLSALKAVSLEKSTPMLIANISLYIYTCFY